MLPTVEAGHAARLQIKNLFKHLISINKICKIELAWFLICLFPEIDFRRKSIDKNQSLKRRRGCVAAGSIRQT
jgi:hypothetical protein